MRNLVERGVGFARQVDRRRSGKASKPVFAIVRECPGQGDDDRREIRLRSAVREVRNGAGREAELTRQPHESVPFDLVRRRRGAPGRQLWVVHRDDRLRDDRRKRHARVEEAEVAGMGYLHLPRSQHPLDICDDIVQRQRLREVIARGQIVANLLRRHRRDNGTAGDLGLELCRNTPDFIKSHV